MKMKNINIKIKEDFTEYPGTRLSKHSDNSGEDLYNNLLKPKYIEADGGNLIVDLDGTAGYANSFLDEAFGRLAHEFNYDEVKERLKIVSEEVPKNSEFIFESMDEWNRLGPPKRKGL